MAEVKPINDQQKKFCEEYLVDLNVTQAMIRAGYSESYANAQGYKLLGIVGISEYIQQLRGKLQDKIEVTPERVLSEYALLAFADIGQAFDSDGSLLPLEDMPEGIRRAIVGIETEELKEKAGFETIVVGSIRKVKFADKRATLDSICKMMGYNKADKVDVTTNGESLNAEDLSKLTNEEKYQLLQLKMKMKG